MKRGDIIVLAPLSPFNKPRPCLIVQAFVQADSENITVAMITSDLTQGASFRLLVHPSPQNGLRKVSHIAVDSLQTAPVSRIGSLVGEMERDTMSRVDAALRLFLGLS